jgi:hypothetical protein
MDINNIIKDLYKYKYEENNTSFLNKVIDYFNKRDNNNQIYDNKYELTGIYIHLLYNKYKFIISQNIIENYSYRYLELNKKQLNNLINQKYGIENNDFKICKKINNNYENIYIIIIHDNNNNLKGDYINIELAFVLLGIESLYFLNHQNLDNYCSDIILNNSDKLFDNLKNFREILNTIPWIERNRIIIFSGLIYHFLGTLYSNDIDITILCNNKEHKEKYTEYFKNIDIDILYLVNDINEPLHELFFYKIPQIRKIDNIYTILINPKYHFYFMGIKCVDILTNFQSFTNRRSNAVSINDTILLKKINQIDYYNLFCIKNFTLRSEKTRIFTDTVINNMFINVINIMKKWWNIDINLDYLKLHFKRCSDIFSTIEKYNYYYCNKYNLKILKYIKIFISSIINNYIKNKNIYDIQFDKMIYLNLYKKQNIKYLYGIDISIYNIENISKKLNKNKIKYNLTNGLFSNQIININTKIDVILLLFSIQCIELNDIFIKNIYNISKKKSIIIITYLNGEKIYNNLIKNNKIEIFFNKKLYWAVYPFNDIKLNKVLFYMRDVNKYKFGLEEKLIYPNDIINIFKDFILIKKMSFLESNIFNKLKPFQKEIISYYELLIFQVK